MIGISLGFPWGAASMLANIRKQATIVTICKIYCELWTIPFEEQSKNSRSSSFRNIILIVYCTAPLLFYEELMDSGRLFIRRWLLVLTNKCDSQCNTSFPTYGSIGLKCRIQGDARKMQKVIQYPYNRIYAARSNMILLPMD